MVFTRYNAIFPRVVIAWRLMKYALWGHKVVNKAENYPCAILKNRRYTEVQNWLRVQKDSNIESILDILIMIMITLSIIIYKHKIL